MRKMLFTAFFSLVFVVSASAQVPLTAIYFDNLEAIHTAGGSTMIDDYEAGVIANGWWDPDGSGSTYGIYYGPGETWSTNSTIFVDEFTTVYAGSTSAMLQYQWASWGSAGFIREYAPGLQGSPQWSNTDKLQVWIYGNNSLDQFRFCMDDSDGMEVSAWVPLNWTGWQLVVFDGAVDPVSGWVTGNGVLDGPNVSLDSYQIFWDPAVPVEMTSFTAIGAQELVDLSWRVESEHANTGFNIYRDGHRIAFVESRGATDAPRTYTWIDKNVTAGVTYTYKIADVRLDGTERMHDFVATAAPKASAGVPTTYWLSQNYPNPFNADTQIEFTLAKAGNTTLKIYNTAGQLVRTLVDEHRDATVHKVRWDGRSDSGELVASGVYFYRLASGTFTETKKMTFLR